MRAVQWCSLILGGEMPPDWQREPEVRVLAVRVLRAWCSANGIGEDLTWLRGWLVRWKVDNAAIRAEWWSEVSADEVRDALARESWAGVLQMVRQW